MSESPQLDEETRKWLFQKLVAEIPRWITPDDPLPEIPEYLKPSKDELTAVTARADTNFRMWEEAKKRVRVLEEALQRIVRAFESDAERVPNLDTKTCWETNSQAVAQAKSALGRMVNKHLARAGAAG